MKSVYKLDKTAFRKKRIWLLIIMILPSLILDAVIIFNTIRLQIPDIKETAMLLLANTLFFKSGGIIIYYILRRYRRNSEVRISPQKVVYRKKRFVGYTFYFGYRIFVEYHIASPVSVARRKSGAITVSGDISTVYYLLDGKQMHSRGIKHRCIIPGYYEDMDLIMKKLERMAADK